MSNKFYEKHGKYIDDQTPHKSHKYKKIVVGTDDACTSCWLRDIVSRNVTQDFKNAKFAGDFYDISTGGRANFYWIKGRRRTKTFICTAFAI